MISIWCQTQSCNIHSVLQRTMSCMCGTCLTPPPPFLSAFSSFSSFFTSSFTFSSLMPSFSRFAACSARAFCTNSSAKAWDFGGQVGFSRIQWPGIGHAELALPTASSSQLLQVCSAQKRVRTMDLSACHKQTAGCRGLPCLKSERSKINTSCSYPPLQYKMACVYHLAKKLCANKRRNGHVYRLNLPLGMLHAEIGLTGCGWMGFPKMGIPLNHPFFGDFHGFSIITWYISYNPCGKSMKIHIIHG